MTNITLLDQNNATLTKGWISSYKALAFIGAMLLATHGWGFTTNAESTVNNNLTVTGTATVNSLTVSDSLTVTGNAIIQKTCKDGYAKLGNGIGDKTICIQRSLQSADYIHEAILDCGDKQARVCTFQDMIYACWRAPEKDGHNYLNKGMWLGTYVADNTWAIVDAPDEGNQCYNNGNPVNGFEGESPVANSQRPYRCCY